MIKKSICLPSGRSLVWISRMALLVKKLPAIAGDLKDVGLIPGSGRSPQGGHGNPLQYSCLENLTNRGLQSMGSQGVEHG